MSYNLLIAYDLTQPSQNYDAVTERIKGLGPWYKLQFSLFYVKSSLGAQHAHAHVRGAMDGNDKLAVFEATIGCVSHYPGIDIAAINEAWRSAA
jgi:hypothetical protein